MSDVKATGETLGDTIHLFGDKLKETAEEAGNMGHQAMETAKDTASNMLSGIVHDISNTAEKVRSVGADVTHSLNEDANKTMHTLKGEFDDVTRQVLDTTHHATDALKNTLQEAEIAGDALKGQRL